VVANPLYNESTSHVEVTAQHNLALQKLHLASLAPKLSQHKHMAYGLKLQDIQHSERAQKYQGKYKSEHHHE